MGQDRTGARGARRGIGAPAANDVDASVDTATRETETGGGTEGTGPSPHPASETVERQAGVRTSAPAPGDATNPPRRTAGTKRRKPAKATARGRRKAAPVRWSARREALFLSALAETSNVAASVRASGLSETTVYRRRRRSAEFRAKWTAALREGYLKLESMMLDRALNGVEKPVWHGGKQVGTVLEYNDRTALSLLAAHRGTVMGTREPTADVPIDELRARMKARLSEMNKRMGGEG